MVSHGRSEFRQHSSGIRALSPDMTPKCNNPKTHLRKRLLHESIVKRPFRCTLRLVLQAPPTLSKTVGPAATTCGTPGVAVATDRARAGTSGSLRLCHVVLVLLRLVLPEERLNEREGHFYAPALPHARSHPLAQAGGCLSRGSVAGVAQNNGAEITSVPNTPDAK